VTVDWTTRDFAAGGVARTFPSGPARAAAPFERI
jgi:hypothetical protein